MTSYTNPVIVPIPFPTGVDASIEACRVKLGAIAWLQKVFGRAIFQHSNTDGADIIYPEVWGPNREPQNVMMNDNLRAYAFFVARDPERITGMVPYASQLYMSKPVSVILWANLIKVDRTKNYRYSEILKLEVLKQLAAVPTFELTQIFEAYNRVFEGFTITDGFRNYLKPPYWAIRIDGNMSFTAFPENCQIGGIPGGGGDFNEDFNNDSTISP